MFFSQSTVLSTLNCRMVLTYPLSLNIDGVARQSLGMEVEVLRNVKVVSSGGEAPAEALVYFRAVLAKVMDPALVDADALAECARLSAGLPREFGLLLRKACLHAHYAGTKVDIGAVRVAERELRIEMIRASQTETTRAALIGVRKTKRLASAEDRRLLDLNLVFEYVNGRAWYDVHPILAPTVDEWLPTSA